MTSLVLDTHALVWYIVEPQKLSVNAINILDSMTNEEDIIYISAISLIELNYLIEKGRLPEIVLERIVEVINYPNSVLVVASVDFNVADAIKRINRSDVPDMPDRIIAATALDLSLPLITRDKKIRLLNIIQTIW